MPGPSDDAVVLVVGSARMAGRVVLTVLVARTCRMGRRNEARKALEAVVLARLVEASHVRHRDCVEDLRAADVLDAIVRLPHYGSGFSSPRGQAGSGEAKMGAPCLSATPGSQ